MAITMKYHIPKGTQVWRNTQGDRAEARTWEYFLTTKDVTYSESDILTAIGKGIGAYKIFQLPAAAAPYRYLFVFMDNIEEKENHDLWHTVANGRL
jgi:hypothetical protein